MITNFEILFYLLIYGGACFLLGVESMKIYRQNKRERGLKNEQL